MNDIVQAPGAATLAAPVGTRTDESGRYLTFVLGGELFALGILDVTEIIENRPVTVVPMMPSFVRGVINLRGRVVPVVDLSARFGRGPTQIARRTSIIIVETTANSPSGEDPVVQDIGLMVDAVNKVVHLDAEDIEPPPAFGAGVRSDFISGMAKADGQFIVVLDVNRVLAFADAAQIEHAVVASGDQGEDAGEPAVLAAE